MQRPQAEFGLGDDEVFGFDFVVEVVVEFAHVDDGDGRREFAVQHDVDAVRCGVTAVRRVRHRDVAGVFGAVFAVQYRYAIDFFEVAVFHAFFDALDVEDDDPVGFAGGHFANVQPFFGVVAGGEGVFALVVGVHVVKVAVHQHLPFDVHGIAVNGGKGGPVVFLGVFGIQHLFAVVRPRDDVLAVGEDVAGFRVALRAQTVDTGDVRDFDHRVAFHHVAADAANAGVRLVIDEDVAAVVGAVGEGHVRVVQVAVAEDTALVFEEFLGVGQHLFAHDAAAFVGLTPAGSAVVVEDRDAHQLAHGRHAEDTDFTRLAARVENVVFVEIARCDVITGFGGCFGARGL